MLRTNNSLTKAVPFFIFFFCISKIKYKIIVNKYVLLYYTNN